MASKQTKMLQHKTITLCLPCRNEGTHIAEVIAGVPDYVDEILVISNASTDDTVAVVQKIGGKVRLIEDNRTVGGIGYGFAHQSGLAAASGDIIVGADGDGTYPLDKIKEVVDYLLAHDLDFLSCNRYPLQPGTTIPLKLRLGVQLLNWEVRLLYGQPIKDILSGMWVLRRSIVKSLGLTAGDWNLSPQIKLQAARHPKLKFSEYPIAQHQRLGETKQAHFKTGLSHAAWLVKNRWQSGKSK